MSNFQREITDIPASDVDKVNEDFKKSGAISVEKKLQSDGNYTLIATFED